MNKFKNYLNSKGLCLDIENLDDAMKCKICLELLDVPRKAACNCRFCDCCIQSYLGNDIKLCPNCDGKNKNLMLTYSELDYDFVIQKSLLDVIVKCPVEKCTIEMTLQELFSHIQFCVGEDTDCIIQESAIKNTEVEYDLRDKVDSLEVMHKRIIRELDENKQNMVQIKKEMNILKESNNKLMEENKRLQRWLNQKDDTSRINALEIGNSHNNQLMTQLIRKIEMLEATRQTTVSSAMCESLPLKKNEKQHKFVFENLSQMSKDIYHASPVFTLFDYKFRFSILRSSNKNIEVFVDLIECGGLIWPITHKFEFSVFDSTNREWKQVKFKHKRSSNKRDYMKCVENFHTIKDSVILLSGDDIDVITCNYRNDLLQLSLRMSAN